MTAVERAAEVIRLAQLLASLWPEWYEPDIAQALIDAGWHDGPKLTDADRAVLDAVPRLVRDHRRGCICVVCEWVRARREFCLPGGADSRPTRPDTAAGGPATNDGAL